MDEITVTVPRERPFGAVAALVLGGVAARHELTIDALDDLQLALDTLLDRGNDAREVNVVLRVDDDSIQVSIGPLEPAALVELDREPGEEIGLRRLLDAVVDDVTVDERADGAWIDLRKGYLVATRDEA